MAGKEGMVAEMSCFTLERCALGCGSQAKLVSVPVEKRPLFSLLLSSLELGDTKVYEP